MSDCIEVQTAFAIARIFRSPFDVVVVVDPSNPAATPPIYIYIYVHSERHSRKCVYVCVAMCMSVYTCIYAYLHTCMHASVFVYIQYVLCVA